MEKNPQKKPVLIDTNVLIAAAEGFALFSELQSSYAQYEPQVMSGTIEELERIKTDSTARLRREADLALQLLKRQDLKIISQSTKHTDDALLEVAGQQEALLLTLDRALQKRARNAGIAVLTVRKRSVLRPVT